MESKKIFKVFFLAMMAICFIVGTGTASADRNRPQPNPQPPCCPPGDINVGVGVNTQLDLGDTNVNVGGPSVNVGGSPVNVSNGSSSISHSSSRSDSRSEANNELNLRVEDEREFLPAMQIHFPGMTHSANLEKAGKRFRRAETMVAYLPNGVTPEQAEHGAETRYWTFSGVDVSLNWLFDDEIVPENQRSERINIVIAQEGMLLQGNVLGFPTVAATRDKAESVNLLFSMVYESWLRGASTIVVTAEGFERIRQSLSIGLGYSFSTSHVDGDTGNVSGVSLGMVYSQAWDDDRPWIQGTALR